MKKIVTFLAVAGFMLSAGSALAQTGYYQPTDNRCNDGDSANYDIDNLRVLSCVPRELSERAAREAQARQSADLSVIVPGGRVVDEGGLTLQCPRWFTGNCIDDSRTAEYRDRMLFLARTLVDTGWAPFFPLFSGWVARL